MRLIDIGRLLLLDTIGAVRTDRSDAAGPAADSRRHAHYCAAADENDAVRACRGVLPSATTTARTLKNRK